MKIKVFTGVAAACLLSLALVVPAQAIPINYTLQGVTFSDGASASGSFVYDATTKSGSVFSVSTTDGVLPAFTYDVASSGFYSGGGAGPNNFILIATSGRRYFNFSFEFPLTNDGGTFALVGSNVYECNNCGTFRRVVAGSITSEAPAAVPEPGTIALLLPSLGILGLIARRRRQVKA